LGAFVDLFPHGQIIICPGVILAAERCAGNVVEHEVRNHAVAEIANCPADGLGHTRERVNDNFTHKHQDGMYQPGAFGVDPFRIEVLIRALVQDILFCIPHLLHFDETSTPTATLANAVTTGF